MRCCVASCRNTPDNVSTSEGNDKRVTFHRFPSEAYLHAAWLGALGKQGTHPPDSAVVCSQHFLSDDIYETESGMRQISTDAIPSIVQVCMICLDTDSKLFLMSKHKLEEAYEKLTGHPMCDQGNLKQTLCVKCAQRLINFSRFRGQSLRARSLMMDLVEKYELITQQHIKMINCSNHHLKYNLVSTMLGPDHCDLHIVERSDEYEQTELEETVHRLLETVEVKNEESYDSMLVDEDMEAINEDETHANNSSDEFVASQENLISDYSIMLEQKLMDDALREALNRNPTVSSFIVAEQGAEALSPLKYESATFKCTFCFEEFLHEHEYKGHMSMHLGTEDTDGECETSQVCEPRTAASTSHVTEHEQAVQKLDGDSHPSADLAQTSAAPMSPTEKADTIKKSKLEMIEGGSENNNKTNININRFRHCLVKLYDICKKREKSRKAIRSCDNLNIDTASKNSHYQAACETEVPATDNSRNISNALQNVTDCSSNDIKIQLSNSPGNSLTTNGVVHIRTHTGEKPYSCELCVYKCANQSNLVRHMRTHTGEKPYSCELCGYKCASNSDLVIHMRSHTGEKPYSCKLCKYKCARNSDLVKHIRTHTGEKPYSCKSCQYKCASNSDLVIHMRSHTGEKPYSCKLCKYKCARNSDLVTHIRTHTGEKPYSCKSCQYKCANQSDLVRHMRTHTGEKPHSCKLCKYKCASYSKLVNHIRTHTGEKPHSCKLCKYKCATKSCLVIHMRSHTGEKPYSCKLCEYKGASNSDLVKHIRTHTGEKPYSCKSCQYKCANQSDLVRHMRTHTGEKPYSCKLCQYKCATKSYLVIHMRSHTGEKPYSCKLCEYKGATKSNLERHMLTHTGEKPYSCKSCQYKCANNSDLVIHMRSHTGEKPYSCKLCEYKGASNSDLVKHIRTHTGEKPYSCKSCQYKCANQSDLVRHMRTHTGEKP